MLHRQVLVGIAAVGMLLPTTALAEMRAERITADNAGELLIGGPEAIGFLPVVMYPVPIALHKKLAQDVCIWVDDDHRKTGAGPALVSAAAKWAEENGASCFVLSSPNGCHEIADMCLKRGFRLLESNYARVF